MNATPSSQHPRRTGQDGRTRLAVLLGGTLIAAAVVAFGVSALLVNIFQHQQDARNPFFRVVELDDDTVDPSIWGKNFPLQYDTYKQTVDMERTRFGGSEAVPRMPDDADPRTEVAMSRLEEDSRLLRMWAGYAFSIDYRQARGHAYMLEDQTFTQRHQVQQYGNCMHCHASVYNAYKDLGEGDIMAGFALMNQMPYQEARPHVVHPVACIDCHDSQTMALRITRPAFIEGIANYKASQGIEDYDVNRDATRQEMRSFVCGQCHVEYYFREGDRRLVYPWFDGLKADEILNYFDKINFTDWVHAETGASMLKAQHPEFELWNQGIHARAGVSCADCHMPYERVGAMKISNHHVRSPLLNINNACQTCHNVPEAELLARAENIQSKTHDMVSVSLDALIDLIDAIKVGINQGVDEEVLNFARDCQRRASFLIDMIESENSSGFHAPQEAARILFTAMDWLRQGQAALAGAGVPTQAGPLAADYTAEMHAMAHGYHHHPHDAFHGHP